MARSFCGYLRHWQAAHLQGATKRQTDHGEGADEHANRHHSAFEVAHTWQRITKRPHSRRRAPTTTKGEVLIYSIARTVTSEPGPSLTPAASPADSGPFAAAGVAAVYQSVSCRRSRTAGGNLAGPGNLCELSKG